MKLRIAWLLVILVCFGMVPAVQTAAEAEDIRTLTIARATDTLIEDLNTNLFTKWIEDSFSVDLRFDEYPSAEAATKFSVIAASGSALPDVVNMTLDNASVYAYGTRGVLVSLNEYWEDPAMTPHFDAVVEDASMRAKILSGITMPDGNIYTLPQYEVNEWNSMSYRMWINKAWLDALNLAVPTTTEAFKAVLEAFATQDPNGNGLQDEIPLMGSTGGYGQNVVPFLLNAFANANVNTQYFYLHDGVIRASFVEDGFKEGLSYLHNLCETGLLYAPSFTQDQTQMRAILNGEGDYVVGALTAGSFSHWTGGETNLNFQDMMLLEPLKGPQGVSYTPAGAPGTVGRWYITSACADPSFAFQIGEAMYDIMVARASRFGEYGVDWTDDPQIVSQYVGIYESVGFEAEYAILQDNWGSLQNKHWYFTTPHVTTARESMLSATVLRTPENNGTVPGPYATFYLLYPAHAPAELIPTLLYTEAEFTELSMIQTAVNSYVRETMTALITGNTSFQTWDQYLVELENMGLARYIELMQTAFDRVR